ncbi:MAG: TIR domain-containing protein [Haliscomenobacteraceae bacterium CHB4]|nr:TIR domain-containing protein [Haliscomenobacteraceae bacterium CHB4]
MELFNFFKKKPNQEDRPQPATKSKIISSEIEMQKKGYEEALKRIEQVKKDQKTVLNLSDLNLDTIPESIGELKNLTEFHARKNQLVALPDSISELKNLTRLDVRNNQICSLPNNIGNLIKLINLEVFKNKITILPDSVGHLKDLIRLDLADNQFSVLPESIGALKQLRELNIAANQLIFLPESIGELENLKKLNISRNKLRVLPESIKNLKSLIQLDVHSNYLSSLPKGIGELKEMTELDVSSNQINSLPENLNLLKKLLILNISDNQITALIESIGELEKLIELNISQNQISTFPDTFSELVKLNRIRASHNCFQFFPRSILNNPNIKTIGFDDKDANYGYQNISLFGNPISDVPPEVLKKGMNAVRAYFAAQENSETLRLYEAKLLIVGEPGAGKTTLAKKVQDPLAPMPAPEATTRGIAVEHHTFKTKDGNMFKINIWDFAGQEIYSATHRFFLTKRSVYALLTDNRRESENFNYWLNIIEILSENSPLLIIQNERDNRKKDLDELGMKGRFSNIKEMLPCNLLDNRGLPQVKQAIEYHLENLPFVGMTLRKEWVDVRNELEQMAKSETESPGDYTPFIEERDYYELCRKHEITDRTEARTWATLLHDLGVLLHFQDNALLRRYMFLSPPWATAAVYRVVDCREIQEQNGFFSKADASALWQGERYDEVHDELLALMSEFKICFPLDGTKDRYVIPQHLRGQPEAFIWDDRDEVRLLLDYRFLPKGVFHQFMVEMHRFLADARTLAWDTGALFKREGAEAWVEEVYSENKISVRVRGNQKQPLLDRIVEQFDAIREQFSGLVAEKKIPCRCSVCVGREKPYLYDYEILKRRLQAGKKDTECQVSFEELSIVRLLGDYFTAEKINRDAYGQMISGQPRIFISYAHKNEAFKDEFREMVAPMEKSGKWNVWDDRWLLPGDNWNREILRHLEEAHVAVLLLTPAFFASDYIYDEEMRRAVERHRRGEMMLIGVLVSDCMFEETPLRDIQIVPKDALPVERHPNRSQIWKSVANKIKETIEFSRGDRGRRGGW